MRRNKVQFLHWFLLKAQRGSGCPRTFGFKEAGVAIAKTEGSEKQGIWKVKGQQIIQTSWYFCRALVKKWSEMAEIGSKTPRTSLNCFQRTEQLYRCSSKITGWDLGVWNHFVLAMQQRKRLFVWLFFQLHQAPRADAGEHQRHLSGVTWSLKDMERWRKALWSWAGSANTTDLLPPPAELSLLFHLQKH